MARALGEHDFGRALRGKRPDDGERASGGARKGIDDKAGFQRRKLLTTDYTPATDGKTKTVANPRVLHVLTGPTAVGKTEWALRWAERSHAEIVSCDSLLFYRGMDIGTAKPTPAERARVPHHLIDIRSVIEPMNVTRYVAFARKAVEEISHRGRAILITGGSGFYLKSFFG